MAHASCLNKRASFITDTVLALAELYISHDQGSMLVRQAHVLVSQRPVRLGGEQSTVSQGPVLAHIPGLLVHIHSCQDC